MKKFTIEGFCPIAPGSFHMKFVKNFYEDEKYYYIEGKGGSFSNTVLEGRINKKNMINFRNNMNDKLGGCFIEYTSVKNFKMIEKLQEDYPLLEFDFCIVDPNLFDNNSKIYFLVDGMKHFFKICKEEKKNLVELANIDLNKLLPKHNFRNHFEIPINIISFNNRKFIYTRFNEQRGVRKQLIFISDENSWNFNSSDTIKIHGNSGVTENTIYNSKIINYKNKIIGVFFCYIGEHNTKESWKVRDKELILLCESNDGINFNEIKVLQEIKNASYKMLLMGGGLDKILYTKLTGNDCLYDVEVLDFKN